MKMEVIQCSETSAYKIQTPGNYPEDNILYLAGISKLPIHFLNILSIDDSVVMFVLHDVHNVFYQGLLGS
jgi:hypothetical protein